MATSEFREYENGVADVLASIVGEAGTVQRNVRLPSRSRVRRRQIDVFATGTIFGLPDVRLVVDCKRWNRPIDVPHVEAFVGLVNDVRATMGLLVSATGVTRGAVTRAEDERGIWVKPLTVAELAAWRPAGTLFHVIEVPSADLERTTKSLREAGLRVRPKEASAEQVQVEAFRHYGTTSPSADLQRGQAKLADTTLTKLQIPHRMVSHGFTISGGTPRHRWIAVRLPGNLGVLNVSAASEAELEDHVARLARDLGVPRDILTVERPDGWPLAATFPI